MLLFGKRKLYKFLRLNKTVIIPEYILPTKKETQYYNITNQEIFEGLGFEVLRIK